MTSKLLHASRQGQLGEAVASGAGYVVLAAYMLHLPLMTPFCILIGVKVSARMGWLFSAGLIFLPLALLFSFVIAGVTA
ncbi:hypothetical protein OHB53_05575 [Streptomyces sp. NBC_00056]|uniref:hypothetical protein n=1 Tax=unclassified Streptomyces TaxID=2593676 RepID=UPI002E803158|nr:hypothetical protein [Streptomyces sp. NBC_00569]WUB91833.1 hypothetical protein OHO83_05550 [Streptomyces sp. NBC_00569]